MNTVQFDPKITTDVQIDWRRHATSHGSDPFADLLADRLKHRVGSDPKDGDARRRHPVSDPVSGRPPRVVLAHARTLRGEAKEVEDADDQRLTDQTEHAPDEECAKAAEDTASTDESTAEADTPAQDKAADASTDTEVTATADQPAQAADDQAQPSDPAVIIVVATQPADQTAAGRAPETPLAPPIPMPAEGESAAPAQADGAANTPPDGSQANTPLDRSQANPDTTPEQQAATAMAEAGLSAVVAATLNSGQAAPTSGMETPITMTQPTALPSAPAAAQPMLPQMSEPLAPVADLVPQPAQPKSERPAMDIKPRPGVPMRANAGAPDPAPSSATAPQPAQPHQTTPLQPSATGEFGSAGDTLDQSLADDGSGQGWALHLAQGAAGKRADFVAQLRQHLQNLPAHEQVAVHIQRALREGTGRFSIQLSPAELGRIHVKLEIDEDKRVTAAVTVERPSTLELLQRDVKGLERALHDAGLNMEGGDLSFSLGHSGDQDFAQDLSQSAASTASGTVLDGQSDGAQPDGPVAQVMDTAAGVVNLQV